MIIHQPRFTAQIKILTFAPQTSMATSFDNIYKKSKLKVCVCLLIFLNNVRRHFNRLASGPNNSHSTFLRSRCCPRTSRQPPVTRARNSTVPESRRRTRQRGRRGARKDHPITICVTLHCYLLCSSLVVCCSTHTSPQERSSHGKLHKTSDIIFHGYLPSQT